MKNILKTLIEMPTVTADLEANRQAIDYIDRFLSERAMHVYRHEFNSHPSLVATTRHTKTPQVLLAAHVDVVPGPPAMFRMVEKDGRIYGRGAYDMKCAIAAYLQIIDEIQDDINKYDIGIMITSDEETGGDYGVKPLLEFGYRTGACVLPDGGENWKFEQSAKGLLWLQLTATGIAAHGSRPWQGESAVEKMMSAIRAIHQDSLFIDEGPDTNIFNVGAIKGGSVFNQIPDYCEADLNFRFLDVMDEHKIRALIKTVCQTYDVAANVKAYAQAFTVDLGDPYVVTWANSFEEIIGSPLQTMRSLASNDARWFAAKGIPTLVTYPKGQGLHSDNEWVDTKAFYQLKDIVHDYINKVARTSPAAIGNPSKALTVPQ